MVKCQIYKIGFNKRKKKNKQKIGCNGAEQSHHEARKVNDR